MSTLRVATIETENETTDLLIRTANTSSASISVYSGNNTISVSGNISGNNNIASTGKAIAMAIVFG